MGAFSLTQICRVTVIIYNHNIIDVDTHQALMSLSSSKNGSHRFSSIEYLKLPFLTPPNE
ncbi:hypothetical protein PPL_08269 [Heterostelium album PN500]|uniref:Uncharacterized protein n=1 Tax=Heterostelium pallidum (strain ATCC 26659 / Pp 5 / PN500) TaxID=670386 RepID=D3BHQ6_HETP5|nr:hypothetical protein PPL_08269 [Heterostelium album PN500]EFA78806.1 hypothetical protein PPL_08269 [Heterostelium album PN500]|eukprot:XP_020430930.1 hypothetical protein PPL_08269 [Heterostelium album PN500]